ncbi:MAG: PhnD/SsuA/transferrin family substrate-binding protein [Alphaproteobacteria bacterium]|nr:PhnD/SsuA/transferrin family substrate-binding protein [Alphaproteobacteria bacterium]
MNRTLAIGTLLAGFVLPGLFGNLRAEPPSDVVKVGVAVIDERDKTAKTWAPLVRELERAIPEKNFVIVPFDYAEADALLKDGGLSFILAGPTYYVDFERRHGISRLATLVRSSTAGPLTSLGGVVAVRSDRKDLTRPEDLKKKRIAATGELALGGWLSQLREFALIDFAAGEQLVVQRYNTYSDAIFAVLNDKADAAFVRTGIIEDMIKDGRAAPSALRVLRFSTAPIGFPLEISTRSYPEWAFAKTLRAPDDLAKRVALTLLSIPATSALKESAGVVGFTVPLDYAPVHELLRSQSMGPYAGLHGDDVRNMLVDHAAWVALVTLLVLVLISALFYQAWSNRGLVETHAQMLRLRGDFERTVAQRTRDLEAEIERRKQSDLERSIESAKVKESLVKTVKAVALTVEMRDPYMSGHQQSVAQLASQIGIEMHLAQDLIDALYLAGLVHDIGMIYVPSEITNRPGPLSEIEFEIVKDHPRIGHEIMSSVDLPWPIADIVLNHHRRLDGSGYPKDIDTDISLEARILGVADVVVAMMSHRPYRPVLGIDKIIAEISQGRGTKFDPEVVDACVKVLNARGDAV